MIVSQEMSSITDYGLSTEGGDAGVVHKFSSLSLSLFFNALVLLQLLSILESYNVGRWSATVRAAGRMLAKSDLQLKGLL